MFRVKQFDVTYEALNEKDTFSEGDTVSGRVTMTLSKETKVKCLLVKLKGEARVSWTEKMGSQSVTFAAHRRLFKVTECLVAENEMGTVLPPGVHDLQFKMKFPDDGMPSSFDGDHGNIVYTLEAKMSRSWRFPSWDTKTLRFVSKSLAQQQGTTCPQTNSVNKEMGLFSKGQVGLSASVNKRVYFPGDTVSVVANIHNPSSKSMKPKFSLHQITVFRATASSTSTDKCLCKCVGKPSAKPEETVACQLKIPEDVFYSIDNCDILSNSYFVKGEDVMGLFPAGAAGGPSSSDLPVPTFPVGPNPLPPGSDGNGYPVPYPAPPAIINNQWAQQPPPYGFPAATFPSSSVPDQAPAAPLQLQQGEGPSSHIPDTFGSGTDHKI